MMAGPLIIFLFGAQSLSFGLQTQVYQILGASVSFLQIVIIVTTLLVFLGLWLLVRFTRFGKAMRATADNEIIAEVLGINT